MAQPIWRPDRRLLLRMGMFGAGALAIPGAAQSWASARGFTHGVASGEPGATSILLWTRYVAGGEHARLTAQIAEDADFARIVASGEAHARRAADFTAKCVVGGLRPGQAYFYRFIGPDGAYSATGRTRTLPDENAEQFRMAIFSCANIGFGYFHAYAHAAARDDIDLAIHLGDYMYEYRMGEYPSMASRIAGRDMLPTGEAIALADYRLRYASYRADPALQALHARQPMVMMWDDHEFANDTWSDGAENHDPASEGTWQARRAAALQAWHEWMPVSDANRRHYAIGQLADIIMPDTRMVGRSRPFDLGDILRGSNDAAASLRQFRDGALQEASRSMMGMEQEGWANALIAASVARGAKWQVMAQQVIMGSMHSLPEIRSWFPADAPAEIRRRTDVAAIAAAARIPIFLDAWDGYPAARARLLGAAQSAGANFISLAGDSHNAWCFNLSHDNRPAGVDFCGSSVTSPGLEAYVDVSKDMVRSMLQRANAGLVWADTAQRGYMHLHLDAQRATNVWHLFDTVRSPTASPPGMAQQIVRHGRNMLG